MASLLASLNGRDAHDVVWLLFVILAVVAFGAAIWLATRGALWAAGVAAVIGVVILVVAT